MPFLLLEMRLRPFSGWQKELPQQVVALLGACNEAGCMRLPTLSRHCRQILATYCYFFQQLVLWRPTNVSAHFLFRFGRGMTSALHFPSQTKDRHMLQPFTAA